MSQLLKDHTHYMTHVKRVSPHTAKGYSLDMGCYAAWLEAEGLRLEDAKGADIERYRAGEAEAGKTPQTINRRVAAIQHFYKWAERTGRMEPEASRFWLEKLKESKSLPKPVPQAEIMVLIDTLDTSSTEGLRDRSLIEFMYGTGLRLSECLNLKLSDVSKDREYVRVVNGKGGKDRNVPVAPCRATLTQWMMHRFKLLPTTDHVFVASNGEAMNARSVQRMVKRRAAEAGLTTTITPHTLRHSYATHLVDAGADVTAVKELLGHESIATTMKYVEVSAARLASVVGSLHPLVGKND